MEELTRSIYPWIIITMLLVACGQSDDQITSAPIENVQKRFDLLSSEKTGVGLINRITESPTTNYYLYEYLYNGGGVALGDINNDGLADIYLTGNMVPDKLYLNKGGMQFEDITPSAISTGQEGWHTGVLMADVNTDGWLDIYVCRSGWYKDGNERSNLLYLNNGDQTFTESSDKFGIGDTSRSIHAAFFDYDGDSDLDLYVMNTPLQGNSKLNTLEVKKAIENGTSPTDRLFRNDNGTFKDVTNEAGVRNFAYGLGLGISDVNDDGWMDIYVSNDYIAPDNLYINNGDGTFSDKLQQMTKHISNFGMGNDIADFNNDALPDIVELDMVSEDHVRSKKNMSGMSNEKFWGAVKVGYHYQYMSNTLQKNNGNGTFSEIAQLAGIAKTDWSWAPLFADLDNDGQKDLFITNGYKRDMRNNDYLNKLKTIRSSTDNISFQEVISLVPTEKIRNYLFQNNGDLTFENRSEEWGLERPFNSNGAAYADLDNDGDLDLVVNNIDEAAAIYQNNSEHFEANNSLRIVLKSESKGSLYGTKVYVTVNNEQQFLEYMPSRGYQSSVEPILHFGLGSADLAEEVKIVYTDKTQKTLYDVNFGKIEINKNSSIPIPRDISANTVFEEVNSNTFNFTHKEDIYDDFEFEILLPHKQSQFGPFFSKGDINNDGLEDVFVGGATGQAGKLFLQTQNGEFKAGSSQPWEQHADREDMSSLFFDLDGDSDLDLYVVSGGNQHPIAAEEMIDRIYVNDGKGNFTFLNGAAPSDMMTSALRVCSADIDGDGDEDLFIGGRTTPYRYPFPAQSYLLENSGGSFFDITEALAPDLVVPGMVTDATFEDIDQDGDPDLIVVGEWMNVRIYENQNGSFSDQSAKWGLDGTEGWWYSVACDDIDNDGDLDIVAGNIGWNSKFKGTPEHPIHIYWNDFDDNGRYDIVLAKEKGQKLLPVRGRECSSEQMPSIKDAFPDFDGFAHATLEDIYSNEKLNSSVHLKAVHMKSTVFLNDGGKFKALELPNIAQAAPINDIVIVDLNEDGNKDLIVAGNMYGAEVETIRYDAGTGLILLGNGDGTFSPMTIQESGFFANGDVKDLCFIETNNGQIILVANNNAPVQIFKKIPATTSLSAK